MSLERGTNGYLLRPNKLTSPHSGSHNYFYVDFSHPEPPNMVYCFLDCFFRKCRISHSKDTFKAAVCIGRQPNSDVWVFGPDLQLTAEGTITNPETSSTLWVQEVFNMEECGKMNKKDQTGPLPSVRLPLNSHSLRDVIKALIYTVHDNTMAAILTIGKACLEYCPCSR